MNSRDSNMSLLMVIRPECIELRCSLGLCIRALYICINIFIYVHQEQQQLDVGRYSIDRLEPGENAEKVVDPPPTGEQLGCDLFINLCLIRYSQVAFNCFDMCYICIGEREREGFLFVDVDTTS